MKVWTISYRSILIIIKLSNILEQKSTHAINIELK